MATPTTYNDIPDPTTRQWIGFFGMVVGMFMAVLDIQIVASSISQIQSGIGATTDEATWVQTSYLIAEVIIIPLTGWLGRALSIRYMFFLACAGFTVMSFLTVFAWNINSMILLRFFQGLFGGALIPSVFSVVYTMFPRRLQPLMSVIIGSVVTIAPTTGPVLGGYLTDVFSWHALFLINIIPGILVCATTWLYVDTDKPHWDLFKKIDFLGIAFIALSLGCLQYILEEGVRDDWFNSNKIIFLASISAVSGILLIIRELTTPDPVINLRAFKNTNFRAGCSFSFIIGLGLYSMVYLLPVQFGLVIGLNSLQIGFYVAVTGFFQFLSAPIAALLSKKIDLRVMLAIGFVMLGTAAILTSGQTTDSEYWEFFLPQALRGLSLMLCFLPINSLSLGTMPLAEVKNASGLYNLTRNLGGAIGLAVFNTFLINWQKDHYAHLREKVTATNQMALSTIENITTRLSDFPNLGTPDLAALDIMTNIAKREALVMTFNDIYLVIGCLFLFMLLWIPFLEKVSFTGPGGDH